eukprot:GHVO01014301.1.p1 GENE.GHVO01014301.1~~GHVO01014301.1.p1  ORF type:complete len:543 (+),score=106.34 GHVO01014301.1:209-1630(+)
MWAKCDPYASVLYDVIRCSEARLLPTLTCGGPRPRCRTELTGADFHVAALQDIVEAVKQALNNASARSPNTPSVTPPGPCVDATPDGGGAGGEGGDTAAEDLESVVRRFENLQKLYSPEGQERHPGADRCLHRIKRILAQLKKQEIRAQKRSRLRRLEGTPKKRTFTAATDIDLLAGSTTPTQDVTPKKRGRITKVDSNSIPPTGIRSVAEYITSAPNSKSLVIVPNSESLEIVPNSETAPNAGIPPILTDTETPKRRPRPRKVTPMHFIHLNTSPYPGGVQNTAPPHPEDAPINTATPPHSIDVPNSEPPPPEDVPMNPVATPPPPGNVPISPVALPVITNYIPLLEQPLDVSSTHKISPTRRVVERAEARTESTPSACPIPMPTDTKVARKPRGRPRKTGTQDSPPFRNNDEPTAAADGTHRDVTSTAVDACTVPSTAADSVSPTAHPPNDHQPLRRSTRKRIHRFVEYLY